MRIDLVRLFLSLLVLLGAAAPAAAQLAPRATVWGGVANLRFGFAAAGAEARSHFVSGGGELIATAPLFGDGVGPVLGTVSGTLHQPDTGGRSLFLRVGMLTNFNPGGQGWFAGAGFERWRSRRVGVRAEVRGGAGAVLIGGGFLFR